MCSANLSEGMSHIFAKHAAQNVVEQWIDHGHKDKRALSMRRDIKSDSRQPVRQPAD